MDKAYCISQVLANTFRVWYGNLGELNSVYSLIPDKVQSVFLTSTASKSTKKNIFKTLNLDKSTHCIERNPEWQKNQRLLFC